MGEIPVGTGESKNCLLIYITVQLNQTTYLDTTNYKPFIVSTSGFAFKNKIKLCFCFRAKSDQFKCSYSN